MLKFEPWLHEEDHGQVLPLLSRLLGQRISGVSYLIAENDFWPHGHRHDEIHEVDMGVEIAVDSGIRFVVSWAVDGLVQGLGQRVLSEGFERRVGTVVDVSTMDQWKPLLGRAISRIGLASHVTEDGCPSTYWSMRIEFEGEGSVVVALGEVDEDLGYHPESLAVLFDETTARSYYIFSSGMSAWGELITP